MGCFFVSLTPPLSFRPRVPFHLAINEDALILRKVEILLIGPSLFPSCLGVVGGVGVSAAPLSNLSLIWYPPLHDRAAEPTNLHPSKALLSTLRVNNRLLCALIFCNI